MAQHGFRQARLKAAERFHLGIPREVCERYLFAFEGRVSQVPDFAELLQDERVRADLGDLARGLR